MSKLWFKTNRVVVRDFDRELIKDIILYRNDLEWMKYQGFKGFTYGEYCTAILALSDITDGLQLAMVNDENQLIGDLYLKADGTTLRFGYTINKSFSRQGITYEVCSKLFEWAKENGYQKMVAGVDPANIPSINLLKKLKMTEVNNSVEEIIYEVSL